MEFKVIGLSNANSILKPSAGTFDSSVEALFKNANLMAKVIERLSGNNSYKLEISGKEITLFSEAKLLAGENLYLKVNRFGKKIQLEILDRSIQSQETRVSMENIWSKGYFSPKNVLENTMDLNKNDISFQKISQFLNVFFPGIEWNENVSSFYWKFKEGEANGFYGKKKDTYGFYFHFESNKIGFVDSYFHWKKEDFSDLLLHCVFDKLPAYFLAKEKLPELKKMLSSNSISVNDIIFHYSTINRDQGIWEA